VGQVRYLFDQRSSQLIVHAFASGIVAIVAHSPKFSVQDFSGEAIFDAEEPAKCSMRMDANPQSLSLVDEANERDLREIQRVAFEEVLGTKRYPLVSFESTSVTAASIGTNHYRAEIDGNLMLHGVRSPQSVTAQVIMNEDSMRAYGECHVKQTNFGIRIVSIADGSLKIKDEVRIGFFIIARREG
jgi:polyisoprenoid-binding protein YceI